MADDFKQRGTNIVVKILGRKFFLAGAGEPVAHVGGKLVSGTLGNGVDEHSHSSISG